MTGSTNAEKAMNDALKRRWENLNREAYGQSTPLLEKVFDLARDLMAELEALEAGAIRIDACKEVIIEDCRVIDCQGPELGGKGKVDLREFTVGKG
jgi:hypothetical protein